MSTVDIAKLNKKVHGFSKLVRFDLKADGKKYDLKLTLADAEDERVVLVCRDVQNLELNPAGNGFDKLLCLEATDMRGDGLERIHFCLEEVKRETLFLHCADLSVERD